MNESSPPTGRRRRWLWSLLLAVALLVAARWWLLDALLVPSHSMEPLVHGDPESGDRVLVWKPYYSFREPQRYDLVVFRSPETGGSLPTYMLKRVAALGGEVVRVAGGDLFVGRGDRLELLRKSYGEFARLLVPVWVEDFRGEWQQDFRVEPELVRAVEGGLEVTGPGDPRRALSCRSRHPVDSSVVTVDGERRGGEQGAVHDVLLRARVRFRESGGGFVAHLNEGQDQFWFVIAMQEGRISVVHQTAAGQEFPAQAGFPGLAPGGVHQIEVWNIDDSLGIAIDGEERLTLAHTPVARAIGEVRVEPAFGVFGTTAVVEELELKRDLYYTQVSPDPVPVPADRVFVLGDHSEASRDSRHFGAIPLDQLVGKPVAVCLPLGRARILN